MVRYCHVFVKDSVASVALKDRHFCDRGFRGCGLWLISRSVARVPEDYFFQPQ